jgi:hypothetical protein
MKPFLSIAILISGYIFTPTIAFAGSGPSFTYVEVSALSRDEKSYYIGSMTLTGQSAKLSVELGDTLYISAAAMTVSGDKNGLDETYNLELASDTFGVGLQFFNGNKTAWFVEIDAAQWTLDETYKEPLLPDDTYRTKPEMATAKLGLRSKTSDQVEINASLQSYYVDFKNGDEESASDTANGSILQLGISYEVVKGLYGEFNYATTSSDLDYSTLSLSLGYRF